jgi:hypothetical protein
MDVNARRRRIAKRHRRERRDRGLCVAALASLELDDHFAVYDGMDDADEAEDDATLWCITFGDPMGGDAEVAGARGLLDT